MNEEEKLIEIAIQEIKSKGRTINVEGYKINVYNSWLTWLVTFQPYLSDRTFRGGGYRVRVTRKNYKVLSVRFSK